MEPIIIDYEGIDGNVIDYPLVFGKSILNHK